MITESFLASLTFNTNTNNYSNTKALMFPEKSAT